MRDDELLAAGWRKTPTGNWLLEDGQHLRVMLPVDAWKFERKRRQLAPTSKPCNLEETPKAGDDK